MFVLMTMKLGIFNAVFNLKFKGLDRQQTLLSLDHKCTTAMYNYLFYLKYMAGIRRILE